jgi:hypothetical protein
VSFNDVCIVSTTRCVTYEQELLKLKPKREVKYVTIGTYKQVNLFVCAVTPEVHRLAHLAILPKQWLYNIVVLSRVRSINA